MTRTFIAMCIISILMIILSVITVKAKPLTYGDINDVEYVRNYDGDTITFNIPNLHPLIGKLINIRVRGIDTPEIRGKCYIEKDMASEARFIVEKMCRNGKNIVLKNVGRDKYFRILADVYVDGVSVADELIKSGFARPYYGGTKLGWCI